MTDKEKLSAQSYVPMDAGFLVNDDKDIRIKEDATVLVDNSVQKVTDDKSEFSYDDWMDAVASYREKQKGTKKVAAEQSATTNVSADNKKLKVQGVSKQYDARVYRPSYRRTAEGFKRYLKSMDKAMACNVTETKESTEKK